MSKNLYILLEGQHEEKFIIDFRENWGEFWVIPILKL